MENNRNYTYDSVIQLDSNPSTTRKFMANVFLWMFGALAVSAGLAALFAFSPDMRAYIVNQDTHSLTGLGLLAAFSPLAFVLLISFGFNRISYPVLAVLFIAYAAVTGISLSGLLLAFTPGSVLGVFITASAIFGVMAVAGYVTHQDLTKFGSLLMMALVGVIVATLVNFFLHSEGLNYIISYLGVAIFVGLTAYDVQKLKRIGEGLEYGDANASKLALMGALSLYLDFVNLFIYLLRIFGRRR